MTNPPSRRDDPLRPYPGAQWIEREQYVEAFEVARSTDPAADLGRFLPPNNHPLRLAVLEELIRIDLEQHWLRGDPRWLEDYLDRFPELLEASASVRTLAFEEFRLRRRAGEAPSADEYQRRFGIDAGRRIRDDAAAGDSGPGYTPGPQTPRPRTDRFAQVMAALPQVGDHFLDYRLLAELGWGAFGRAFLAERAGRRVALKVGPALGEPHPFPSPRGAEGHRGGPRHQNIVSVEEVFQVGSFRAVVMPYLGGITLAHVLRGVSGLPEPPIRGLALFAASRPELPPAELPAADAPLRAALEAVYYADAVLWLAVQIADGLACAHGQGILHLDLKPANVLFTAAGRPMLLDFPGWGMTREAWFVAGGTRPANHELGGTLPYMAPEQIDALRGSERTIDCRADLFALGVMLYQFLAGRLPFASPSGDCDDTLAAVATERQRPAPDPVAVNGAVPPPAAAVVRRLLAPDPADRFANARTLIGELRHVLRDSPLPLPAGPGWFSRWLRR